MAKDTVPPSAIEAVKHAVEVGGDKEISALTTELNNMTLAQIQALSKVVPSIQAEASKGHPDLPVLTLSIDKSNYSDDTTHNAISVSRVNPAELKTPVQEYLKQYGFSRVESEKLYNRSIDTKDNSVIKDQRYDSAHRRIFTYDNDLERGVESEFSLLPNGITHKVYRSSEGITVMDYDPKTRRTHEVWPNGMIRDSVQFGGMNFSRAIGVDDTVVQRVITGKDELIQSTKGDRTEVRYSTADGLQKSGFINADGSSTMYEYNRHEGTIIVNKVETNGTKVHEEYASNGRFQDGTIQKKGDWWPSKLTKAQESPNDIKALETMFYNTPGPKYLPMFSK